MAAGRVILLCVVALWPRIAAAQVFAASSDVPPYYSGAVYSYTVSYDDATFRLTRAQVNLRDYLELVSVIAPDGTTPLLTERSPACGAPPRVEGPVVCGATSGCTWETSITASELSGEQIIEIVPATSLNVLEPITIYVRLCPAVACSVPQALFETLGPTNTIEDPAAAAACNDSPGGVMAVPDPVSAPRRATALATELTFVPELSGGQPINAFVTDPTVFGAAFACQSPGGSFGPCDQAPFASFMSVRATRDTPATLELQAHSDSVDPPSGNATMRVDVNALLGLPAGTVASIDIPVGVEEPVVDLEVEIDGAPAPASHAALPGSSLQFAVVAALNAFGGFEPRAVTWSIGPATLDGGSGPDVSTWLNGSGPQVEVSIPIDVFDAGGENLLVPVTAFHPASGHEETITLAIANVELPVCRTVLQRDVVQPKSWVGLRLEIEQPTGEISEVVDGVEWHLDPDLGVTERTPAAADSFAFHYRPPVEAPVGTQVSLRGNAPVCPRPADAVTVTLGGGIGLRLDAQRQTIRPGGMTRLSMTVSKPIGEPVEGLRLYVRLPAGLKPVRRLPVAGSNTSARALLEDAASCATGTSGALAVAVDVASDVSEGELVLPVLARQAAAGSRLQISALACHASSRTPEAASDELEPVARASQVITVLEDPEFSEATLFGKVFHDKNGDGVQQEGESGFGRAMVAVSTGVYALTDGHGRYHIARLEPGRHAVKLNLASLPLAVTPTTDVRREVTLTPGSLTRVSFGVRFPDLNDRPSLALVMDDSGVIITDKGPRYRAVFSGVAGETLVARHGDLQRAAELGAEGRWTLELPLGGGWLLVERNADGRVWLSGFALFSYERAEGGTLIIPWGPEPVARMLVPPPKERVRRGELVLVGDAYVSLSGHIEAKGTPQPCQLRVELKEGETQAPIRCHLQVHETVERLTLYLDPGTHRAGVDLETQPVQLGVQVDPVQHFFVGLAGVEAGAALHRQEGDDLIGWHAGGAFFYRGILTGGYQITAGADLRARDILLKDNGGLRSLGGIGAQLLEHHPRRVFRDLDPEDYYPTYGDDSQTIDEREAGGRFFLRIQKEQSYLKWGGINTAIDDAEVGRFVRSLYGLGGVLALGDQEDKLKLRAVLFAAQPDSLAARDELTLTGGTLYFLGHRDLVEGSLRVTLEVLDEISGLPVRNVPLVEGADFEADYAGGRMVLDSALPYRFFGQSLTADEAGGHRGRLLVEYEYVPGSDPTSDWSVGARAVGSLGPFSLGVTGVTELLGLESDIYEMHSRYWLAGTTARLDLGQTLRLRIEAAHSDGGAHDAGRSYDGGLTFSERVRGDVRSGNAVAVELSTGAGGMRAGLYGRLVEPGFSDSHTSAGRRLVQAGLRLGAKLATRTRLWGNYDHRETRLVDPRWVLQGHTTLSELVVRDVGVFGISQQLGAWDVSVEGRHESLIKQDEHRTLVGGEVTYQVLPELALSVRRRQRLRTSGAAGEDSPQGETSAGVMLDKPGDTRLAAEVGVSDELQAFGRAQGSMAVVGDTEIYAGYQVASHLWTEAYGERPPADHSIVAGGRRSLSDGTLLYSEQNLQVDGSDRLLTRTVGASLPLSGPASVSVTYERGALDGDDTLGERVVRDALSVGASLHVGRVSLEGAADARLDRKGEQRTAQLGGRGRALFRASEALTLSLAGRGASGFVARQGQTLRNERRSWEGAVGFALRPIDHDAVNIFGRYALTLEREREGGDGIWLQQTSHVVAGALVYEIWGPLAVSPKAAYRNTRVQGADTRATDQALLAALRGDIHMSQSWDVGIEGRVCAVPGSQLDPRVGALAEASLLVVDWLRFGAGYNFSSISAHSVYCEQPGARGVFVRAEVVY